MATTNTVNLAELKKKAKLPARQAGGSTVKEFFEANKTAMAAVLPKHVSSERMLRLALTAVRSVPQLMECTTESLMGAVMQCAQLGLEPNTPLGHAYMIPFRNRKANRTDVQVIVGYKGLIDLARRSGQIISLAAHAVYERDEFDFAYGLDERLYHVPARGERGEIIAFYAVAKLRDGGHQFEVLWREDVDSIMRSTQSRGEYGPWHDHYEEMGRKTAIRRLAKYLPLSIEFATAAAIDGLAEAGKDQHLDQVLTGEWTVVSEPGEDDDGPQTLEAMPDAVDGAPNYEAENDVAAPSAGGDPSVWPQRDDEGRWIDSSGEIYDPDRHGWNVKAKRPSVTSSGRFRARRRSRIEAEAQRPKHPVSEHAENGNPPPAPEHDHANKEWLDDYEGASDLE